MTQNTQLSINDSEEIVRLASIGIDPTTGLPKLPSWCEWEISAIPRYPDGLVISVVAEDGVISDEFFKGTSSYAVLAAASKVIEKLRIDVQKRKLVGFYPPKRIDS